MNRRVNILVLSFSLLGFTAGARVLTVDDCVKMALQNNKEIKIASLREVKYSHVSKSLKANFFPNIYLQAVDTWSSLDGKVDVNVSDPVADYVTKRVWQLAPSIAGSDIGSWYLSSLAARLSTLNPVIGYKVGNVFVGMIQMEQPVYMGGKVRAAYKMGQLGEKMATLGKRISEDEAVVRTYEAYALLIKAEAMREVAIQYDSLITVIQKSVESARRNGMGRQADAMKVQSARSKSELQLRQAANGCNLARMNLCQVIGLPILSDIEILPMNLEVDPYVEEFDNDLRNRAEFGLLDAGVRQASWKVKFERSNFLPQIGLFLGGGYINGVKVMDQNLFDRMHFTAGINLKIPIFHAMEGYHKVKAAESEYEQARLERRNLMEKMVLEVQKARNELDEIILETELDEALVEESGETLRVVRLSYENGFETISEVLSVQTEWHNRNAQLIDARHRLQQKKIEYLKTLGKLNYGANEE